MHLKIKINVHLHLHQHFSSFIFESKNGQLPKVLRPSTSRHTANTWARNYGRLTIFRLRNEKRKMEKRVMFDDISFYF